MSKLPPHGYAFLVAALSLIGAVVLSALHDTVAPYLWALALSATSGGAGLATPTSWPAPAAKSTTTTTPPG